MKLYDAIGQEIYFGDRILLCSTKRRDIDLSFLPTGVYFLKLETKEYMEIKKIIKN